VLTPTGIAEQAKLNSKFLARKVAANEILNCKIKVLKAELDKKRK
jgi:hypothetical protein